MVEGMLLAYCFLGVCALIIFLQILPVLALGYGMFRSFFGKNRKNAV